MKIQTRLVRSNALALAAAALLGPLTALAGPVEVADAWIREAPPTSRVLAGYMRVHNASDSPVAITGASSPAVGRIELHRTEVSEGVARMLPQERVEIPPGETVAFEPGGLHLMLFDPAEPLRAGAGVPLSLEMDGADSLSIEAEVRRMTGGDMGHAHHHHHH